MPSNGGDFFRHQQPETVSVFSGVGLLVSLVLGSYGWDLGSGFFLSSGRMADRRMTSSGRLRGFDSDGTTFLQLIFRCYHRLRMRPDYRNGCIGRAVAALQRVLCFF
jgi:hypothetical protein